MRFSELAAVASLCLSCASDAGSDSAGDVFQDVTAHDATDPADLSHSMDDVPRFGSDISDASNGDAADSMPDGLVPTDTTGETEPDTADTGASDGADGTGFEWIPDPDTVPVFEDGSPKTLELTFTAASLTGLLHCWKNPTSAVKKGKEKCWFHCTATFGGMTSADAGCRPKGSPNKWPDQNKPPLIVRFDPMASISRTPATRCWRTCSSEPLTPSSAHPSPRWTSPPFSRPTRRLPQR